jgi:hypothetical protein
VIRREQRAGATGVVGTMRLVAWVSWFSVLLVLWLLYVGQFRHDILAAGVVCAALTATFAVLMHRAGLFSYRISPLVLARESRALLKVYPDFVKILGAVARGRRTPTGGFRWVDFPYGAGDDERAAADRAIVTTASSLAPSSFVVHIDGRRGRMLVHDLGDPG